MDHTADCRKAKVWECRIGWAANADLPEGADGPMRAAVEEAYERITGRSPEFIFSGWGAELSVDEARVVAAGV
jgi:hypothetical protein